MDDSRRGCDSGSLERARSTRLRRGMRECGSLCAPLSASGPEYWRGAAAPPTNTFRARGVVWCWQARKKTAQKVAKTAGSGPDAHLRHPSADSQPCSLFTRTVIPLAADLTTTPFGIQSQRWPRPRRGCRNSGPTHQPQPALTSSLRLLVHVSDFV